MTIEPSNVLLLGLGLGALVLKLWALVDALVRPAAGYPAAGKLTKPAWVAILAVSVLFGLYYLSFLAILSVIGTIAAVVYLVDVRPALRELGNGGPWG